MIFQQNLVFDHVSQFTAPPCSTPGAEHRSSVLYYIVSSGRGTRVWWRGRWGLSGGRGGWFTSSAKQIAAGTKRTAINAPRAVPIVVRGVRASVRVCVWAATTDGRRMNVGPRAKPNPKETGRVIGPRDRAARHRHLTRFSRQRRRRAFGEVCAERKKKKNKIKYKLPSLRCYLYNIVLAAVVVVVISTRFPSTGFHIPFPARRLQYYFIRRIGTGAANVILSLFIRYVPRACCGSFLHAPRPKCTCAG